MANTASFVTTGKPKKSGAIYRAPLGTALPTDASTALAATYVCLGYASSDGVTNNDSKSTSSTAAWGGDIVLVTEGEHEDTFAFTLIEAMNADVLKAVYNDSNVTGTLEEGITVTSNSDEHDECVYVIDLLLKNGGVKRIVIPDGKVTELSEITYNDSDPVGYGVTVTAFPYTDGTETYNHKEYLKR